MLRRNFKRNHAPKQFHSDRSNSSGANSSIQLMAPVTVTKENESSSASFHSLTGTGTERSTPHSTPSGDKTSDFILTTEPDSTGSFRSAESLIGGVLANDEVTRIPTIDTEQLLGQETLKGSCENVTGTGRSKRTSTSNHGDVFLDLSGRTTEAGDLPSKIKGKKRLRKEEPTDILFGDEHRYIYVYPAKQDKKPKMEGEESSSERSSRKTGEDAKSPSEIDALDAMRSRKTTSTTRENAYELNGQDTNRFSKTSGEDQASGTLLGETAEDEEQDNEGTKDGEGSVEDDSVSKIKTSLASSEAVSTQPATTLNFDVETIEEEGRTQTMSHVNSTGVASQPKTEEDSIPAIERSDEDESEEGEGEEDPSKFPSETVKWSSDRASSAVNAKPEKESITNTVAKKDPVAGSTPRDSASLEKTPRSSEAPKKSGLSDNAADNPKGSSRGKTDSVNVSGTKSIDTEAIPKVMADEQSVDSKNQQKASQFENVYSEAPTGDFSNRSLSGRPGSKKKSATPPSKLPYEDTSVYPSEMPSAYSDAPKASGASLSEQQPSRSSRPSFPSQTFFEQEEDDLAQEKSANGPRESLESGSIKIMYEDHGETRPSARRKTTTTEEAFVKDRESHMRESTYSSNYPDSELDPKNPSRSAVNTTIKMSSSGTETESQHTGAVTSEYESTKSENKSEKLSKPSRTPEITEESSVSEYEDRDDEGGQRTGSSSVPSKSRKSGSKSKDSNFPPPVPPNTHHSSNRGGSMSQSSKKSPSSTSQLSTGSRGFQGVTPLESDMEYTSASADESANDDYYNAKTASVVKTPSDHPTKTSKSFVKTPTRESQSVVKTPTGPMTRESQSVVKTPPGVSTKGSQSVVKTPPGPASDQAGTASVIKTPSEHASDYRGPNQSLHDGQSTQTGEHFGSYDSNKLSDEDDPQKKGVEVEVVPVYSDGHRPVQGDRRDDNEGDQAEQDKDVDESGVPDLDYLSSGESDAQSAVKGRRRPSKADFEDRLKRKFILDGVCCDFLSHGYYKCNPRIQCVRPPYNSIKDPNTGKYFENEHVVALLNKTGMLDYNDPEYRGVSIEGPYEDRAYNIGEFHCILSERNRHGCGRAYESYKGIDLFYDLPRQKSNRTFEQQVQRWKELVIPGYRRKHRDDFELEDDSPGRNMMRGGQRVPQNPSDNPSPLSASDDGFNRNNRAVSAGAKPNRSLGKYSKLPPIENSPEPGSPRDGSFDRDTKSKQSGMSKGGQRRTIDRPIVRSASRSPSKSPSSNRRPVSESEGDGLSAGSGGQSVRRSDPGEGRGRNSRVSASLVRSEPRDSLISGSIVRSVPPKQSLVRGSVSQTMPNRDSIMSYNLDEKASERDSADNTDAPKESLISGSVVRSLPTIELDGNTAQAKRGSAISQSVVKSELGRDSMPNASVVQSVPRDSMRTSNLQSGGVRGSLMSGSVVRSEPNIDTPATIRESEAIEDDAVVGSGVVRESQVSGSISAGSYPRDSQGSGSGTRARSSRASGTFALSGSNRDSSGAGTESISGSTIKQKGSKNNHSKPLPRSTEASLAESGSNPKESQFSVSVPPPQSASQVSGSITLEDARGSSKSSDLGVKKKKNKNKFSFVDSDLTYHNYEDDASSESAPPYNQKKKKGKK